MADRLTQEQFRRWKKNHVGSVFFKFLEDNVESNKAHLESIAKNPGKYSQEDYYKKCFELGITIKTWQELLDVEMDFIQGEEDAV